MTRSDSEGLARHARRLGATGRRFRPRLRLDAARTAALLARAVHASACLRPLDPRAVRNGGSGPRTAALHTLAVHPATLAALGVGLPATSDPWQQAREGALAGRGMIEWQPNQSDAAAPGRNRAVGSAVCERHATVLHIALARWATGRRLRGRRPRFPASSLLRRPLDHPAASVGAPTHGVLARPRRGARIGRCPAVSGSCC
jgi:hypothetical protein